MFKTIFGRVMWANIAIIIISFMLIGVLIFSLLGNYALDQKTSVLETVANQIASKTISLQIENSGVVYDRMYAEDINMFEDITDSSIFIVNSKGNIVAKSATLVNMNSVSYKFIEDTLSGETSRFIGNLDGALGQDSLTVGYPIKYRGEVVGGVFLSSSKPETDYNRMLTVRLFVNTGAMVLLIAFFMMFFVSRRMTKPLQKINQAAKNIAAGNFKNRVDVDTKDEIGQLASTFNYMADSLAKIDDMQSSFVANVSHELRTPMTTISGFIEKILDGTIPPERQPEYLQIALDESMRLSRLVSDMLDISKISVGQYALDIKPFDITELIRLTIIKFENAIDSKALDLHVEFEHENISVIADKDSISRVVTNLMDNAIKFSDPASHINIKVFIKSKKAYVAIQNEGMGIDPQDIHHIWDRFYKTDRSRSGDKKGAGLGLYMVKNLISVHGESIVVQSVGIPDDEFNKAPNHPARRTTFIFSLELA